MTEAPQVPAVEIISPKVVKWAERINSAARKGLKSILAVCYEVFLAHEDCLRGEWLQLIDSGLLVFKRAHVYRLLKIGTELERFQKLPLGVTLPADTHTLWSLASLSLERFHKLIENGTINPSMKRTKPPPKPGKREKKKTKGASSARSLRPASTAPSSSIRHGIMSSTSPVVPSRHMPR